MADSTVLPVVTKDDALADDVDAVADDIISNGKTKGTPTDFASASDSVPHAAPALDDDATKPGAGVPKKKGKAAVRANLAFAVLFGVLAASPVLRAFTAIFSKLTATRATFLVWTLLALWLSAGHPCTAVWTFTVITISYLGLWTIYLSESIQPITVLVSITYPMFFACSVTHLSSVAGVFLMLIDTAYAAGLFGYALGEYRLRKGYEPSAEVLVTRMKDKDLKDDKAVIAMVSLYATIASLIFAVGAALVIFYSIDIYWTVVVLCLLIDLTLFYWVGFVGMHLLHAVLFADYHMAFIFWGIVLLVLPDFLLSYMFGEAIGVLVHLVGVIGVAGVLGYSLSVYVCYNKHVSIQ